MQAPIPIEQTPKEISFKKIKNGIEPKQIKEDEIISIINKAFLLQLLSEKEKNSIPTKAIRK